MLAGAAAWGWLTTAGQLPDAAGLQVLFIGLAALTLPHMLLVDRLRICVDVRAENWLLVRPATWAEVNARTWDVVSALICDVVNPAS